MRGTIVKRYSKWSVVIELDHDPATGKRRREWHSGVKSKKEAEAARIEILANLQRGEHVSPDKVTVRAFLEDEWLPAMGPSLRPSTYEGYKLDVRRVTERIGERRLQSLTPAMLTRLYGELGEHLAPRTVRGVHTVLSHALADAVAWQRLPRNPADRAKPPSLASIDDMPPRTWSAAELDRFLDHVVGDRLAAAWRVLALTGVRRGELLGLSWDAVALEAGVHPKVVQERLGHATIAITLDTYSHAIPAMQEDAAAKIAALLEG
jgi:integrase